MKQIPLTKGKFTVVDDDMYDKLIAMGSWYCSNCGYAVRRRDTNNGPYLILMHRLILELSGVCINGLEVDHINGDRLDNRLCNLRAAAHAENGRNSKTRRNNTSGYKGVSFYKRDQKWMAGITLNGKQIYLGYFDSAWQAAAAYDAKAKELYGEFARLNFTNDLGSDTFLAAYDLITKETRC